MTFARNITDSYLRDWTYGATGGIVSTIIILSAVVGADLPNSIALMLGLANLAAIGFATAARKYSNTKVAQDIHRVWRTKPAVLRPSVERSDLNTDIRSSVQTALGVFVAFVLSGLIPLVTCLLIPGEPAIWIMTTVCTLFAIGSAKSSYSLLSWWQSGLDRVFLGTCAAALAFAIARSVQSLIGFWTY
jgi:vacuolar iron transporter family protein